MISKKVVLCVDDDSDDRFLIRECVSKTAPQLQFIEASNGREALSMLRDAVTSEQLPSIVLLDINMPIMDGRITLDRIREDNTLQDLFVVVLTTSESPSDQAFFKTRGVTMVTKPFDYRLLQPLLLPFLQICM